MSVPDFERFFSAALTTILFPSILSTTPSLLVTIVAPESIATPSSIPVPTKGDSGFNKGTAWRIILEPIKALFASSFSKKGINDAATDTNCLGETSIYSITSGLAKIKLRDFLHEASSSPKVPFSLITEFAWAIVYFDSSIADRYSISFVTFPFTTFLYGLSINPYLLTLEYVAKLFINPMLGPSGVSIGHILP